MEKEVERISPEKAIEIFKKDGVEVSKKDAEIILKFLYQMAEIVVDQHLKKAS